MRISITDPQLISIAVREFQSGSIVVFPTETSYGLGTIGLKWNNENIKQIYEIKSREFDKPLSLLITKNMISKYIESSQQIQKIFDKVWPGNLTIVLFCNQYASQVLSPLLNMKDKQKLAFRVPKHDLLLKIIDKVGSPIIGTSANKSGSTPKYDIPSIIQDLTLENIHLWIDAGRLAENPPSTIVDLTDPLKPALLRRGKMKISEILVDII